MTGPRRPLFVAHSARPGGANEVLLGLLRHRPEETSPACVFLEEGPFVETVAELGVPVSVIPAGRAAQVWRVPTVARAVAASVGRMKADLVFASAVKAHLYAS